MARTVEEIKKIITQKYLDSEDIRNAYQLNENDVFEDKFSKLSIENIIFYVIAFISWTVETLFDKHKDECKQLLDEQKAHGLKWYRNKALAFQYGENTKLLPDSDIYDNSGKTDNEIANERKVKYASVVELDGLLKIKVAGETSDGKRGPLKDEYYTALKAYFAEVKDAGVRLQIVNQEPDKFACAIDIYYNPMVMTDNKKKQVRDAIKSYIENLPFNGEYRNAALVDVLQKIDGVVIPELKWSSYRYGNHKDFIAIDARATPDSGYFSFTNDSDLAISWIPYNTL